MSNAFVVSSVKRSYSGDLYLPLLVFYNLVLYLIKHKYKKLELTDVNNGSYDNVIVNDEKDINKFFDMLTDDSFLKLDKRIHKKGSDLIQYLKVPYDDAKKMKGFPKKWIVNFKDK